MDKQQLKNLVLLCAFGLAYFILFVFPNMFTLGSDNPAVYLHQDEFVTYPIVERMLTLEGDIHTLWGRWIIYGDYHYGYPFYLLSALALLPFRLMRGLDFFEDIPFNILVLRQMINVLPMVLTAGILSYLQTRFRSAWKSIFLFLLILTIPAVVRSNIHWWHPDSITLLAIALTFLFLEMDDCRLGRHFMYAAVTCGMASAIKLMGFFFFLTNLIYLLISWKLKRHSLKKVLASALLFVLVMALVILLSNPFLFYKVPREEMLAIQAEKSAELTNGYAHEDSLYYSTAPRYWRWTLYVSYGKPWMMVALAAWLAFGCLRGSHKRANGLIAAWTVPIGIYLLWFVAPKPDHYLLPLMLPLFSTALNLEYALESGIRELLGWMRIIAAAGMGILAAMLAGQVYFNITRSIELILPFIAY